MHNLVTVIMPCYNQAKYARDAIESVLKQTYGNFELLLIDNGSTDGTRGIIVEYATKDKRVHAIFNKKNLGYGGSINRGFRNAKGSFIALTSSDDNWYPNKLEVQMAALNSHPAHDIVHANAHIIDGAGRRTGKTIRQLYRTHENELSGNVLRPMTRKNLCCTSTALFRKKCLRTGREFDHELQYAHDWWFYIKLAKKHKFLYAPECLADYRVHSTNLTRNKELVYGDYFIIHSRLAKMGIESHKHLIAASFAAAILGKPKESRERMDQARTHGKLSLQDRATLFMIEQFGNNPSLLLSINEKRHLLVGFIYGLIGK